MYMEREMNRERWRGICRERDMEGKGGGGDR